MTDSPLAASPRSRFLALTALATASALVLTACATPKVQISGDADPSATGAPSTGDTSLDALYSQTLDWRLCDGLDLECADVTVPLDWDDPTGDTITVRISRYAATNADERIGSLLVNPGGPGSTGLWYAESVAGYAGADLTRAYDIIGFDPRGVGESTAVSCGTDEQLDEFFLTDFPLEDQALLDQSIAVSEAFGQACLENSGELLAHVDTQSTARDMDLIRSVLGDDELYYFGFSYGTELGATYAALYPENVGRMILDGAYDFLSDEDLGLVQAAGFELAIGNFIDWCLDQDQCPLSGDVQDGKDQVTAMLATAASDGYRTSWGTANSTIISSGVFVTLYDRSYWDYLMLGLDETINDSTADIFYQLGMAYVDRDPDTGEWLSNLNEAFTAIRCIDSLPEDIEPWTVADLQEYRAELEAATPTFADAWLAGGGAGCDEWPVPLVGPVETLDTTDTALPIVVFGATGDPATPVDSAIDLADRLQNSRMVVREGEGHGSISSGNQCVIRIINEYYVDEVLPEDDSRC